MKLLKLIVRWVFIAVFWVLVTLVIMILTILAFGFLLKYFPPATAVELILAFALTSIIALWHWVEPIKINQSIN